MAEPSRELLHRVSREEIPLTLLVLALKQVCFFIKGLNKGYWLEVESWQWAEEGRALGHLLQQEQGYHQQEHTGATFDIFSKAEKKHKAQQEAF